MSYRCEKCGRVTPAGEKQYKIITEGRGKIYPNGSIGWEIVKEIGVCSRHKEVKNEQKQNTTS